MYACHGFNNETEVRGTDGHVVQMHSGNTYRFRMDGSRIEHFTHGQVNPFGMAIDSRGNFFTTDCHSKPIYQLLHGGYYPSFGKPHDGIGFVPEMMQHTHNSTAIDGCCFYDDSTFPESYRGNFFSGNVMTGRVNRDRVEFHGSTMLAKEESDLVETSDPWFRPVDIQLGPDGAIYIADFYNKIIGHYEVDLKHPGRDRKRGRIWRVTYSSDSENDFLEASRKNRGRAIDTETFGQMLNELQSPNITRRMLAYQIAASSKGEKRNATIKVARRLALNSDNDQQTAFCYWILERHESLTDNELLIALKSDGSLTRLYALQILAERKSISETQMRSVLEMAKHDIDAFVRRKAIEVIGLHPDPNKVTELANIFLDLKNESSTDLMLLHAIRIAAKRILQIPDGFSQSDRWQADRAVGNFVSQIAIAVPTTESASFLIDFLIDGKGENANDENIAKLTEQIRFVAPLVSNADINRLATFAREQFAADWGLQRDILFAIDTASHRRDAKKNQNDNAKSNDNALNDWALEIARKFFQVSAASDQSWRSSPLPNSKKPDIGSPWALMKRDSADGKQANYLCTLPNGEQQTGIIRSPVFEIPKSLSFYSAGHNGHPKDPEVANNVIRLIDPETNAILREQTPPRNDLAQKTTWDLSDIAGHQGQIEIVDGDARNAFAWLAVGRFEPAVVSVPTISPDTASTTAQSAAQIVERFQLASFNEELEKLLRNPQVDFATSAAAANAYAALRQSRISRAFAKSIESPLTPEKQRQNLIDDLISTADDQMLTERLQQTLQLLPTSAQLPAVTELGRDEKGTATIVQWLKAGKLSLAILRNQAFRNQMDAVASADDRELLDQITSEMPQRDEQLIRRIAELRKQLRTNKPNLENGKAVFTKNCSACHQVAGIGKTNGPQLDGVGNRGIDRMLEDIFLPNLNVDVAFRTTVLETSDGRAITGLVQNDTGTELQMVNAKGESFVILKKDVVDRFQTTSSLMPENWLDLLKEEEIHDLVGYLSRLTANQKEKEID